MQQLKIQLSERLMIDICLVLWQTKLQIRQDLGLKCSAGTRPWVPAKRSACFSLNIQSWVVVVVLW